MATRIGQNGNSNAASALTIAQSLGVPVQPGDLICVLVGWGAAGATLPTSVKDDLDGIEYTLPANATQQDAGNSDSGIMLYHFATVAGTPTVTVTWGAAQPFRAIVVTAYNDANGLVFDKAVSALPLAANPASSGNIVIAKDGSILHGGCFNFSNFVVPSVGAGFTAGQSVGDGATTLGGTTEWKAASAGNDAVTFTNPGTPTLAVFAVAFSPLGVPPRRQRILAPQQRMMA